MIQGSNFFKVTCWSTYIFLLCDRSQRKIKCLWILLSSGLFIETILIKSSQGHSPTSNSHILLRADTIKHSYLAVVYYINSILYPLLELKDCSCFRDWTTSFNTAKKVFTEIKVESTRVNQR